jgi:hypothetical protein
LGHRKKTLNLIPFTDFFLHIIGFNFFIISTVMVGVSQKNSNCVIFKSDNLNLCKMIFW